MAYFDLYTTRWPVYGRNMQKEMIHLHLHTNCGALWNSTSESYLMEKIYVSCSVARAQKYSFYIKYLKPLA